MTGESLAEVREVRRKMWQHGFRPVPIYSPGALDREGNPIPDAGKRPIGKDWREKALRDPPAAVSGSVSPTALNTGILTDGLVAVDVDVRDQGLVDALVYRAERGLGPTPLVRIGCAPKTLLVYRAEGEVAKMATPELYLPDGTKAQLEILGTGQQFVADGIHPDTGRRFTWLDRSPLDLPLTEVPIATADMARALVTDADAILRQAGGIEKQGKKKPGRKRANGHDRNGFFSQVNAVALADLRAWFPMLLPRARYYDSTGAWRITSTDLGRNLQEDLSAHPDGIWDYGTEPRLTLLSIW
jgi:hypothetical protein